MCSVNLPPLELGDSLVRSHVLRRAEELSGKPLFSSDCAYGCPGDTWWHDVTLTVFPNGFHTCPTPAAVRNGAKITCCMFEAFTVVATKHNTQERESTLHLTMFDGRCRTHTFMFCEADATAHCSSLERIFHGVLTTFRLLLFPRHEISVSPVPEVESTHKRIMAGYLLTNQDVQDDAINTVCIVYGELGSFCDGTASFIIYTDDRCVSVLKVFEITKDLALQSYNADHCSIFEVNHCRFCARTRAEMMLWARALINVKVKLLHAAPNPTKDELEIFRAAVLEQVVRLESLTSSKEPLFPIGKRLLPRLAAEGGFGRLDLIACPGDIMETKCCKTGYEDRGSGFDGITL